MLPWKTAEFAVLGRALGDLPILLFDDVSRARAPGEEQMDLRRTRDVAETPDGQRASANAADRAR